MGNLNGVEVMAVAEDEMIKQWLPLIKHITLSRKVNSDWVNDIIQNASVKVLKCHRNYTPIYEALVVTITKNACVDEYRKHVHDAATYGDVREYENRLGTRSSVEVILDIKYWCFEHCTDSEYIVILHILEFKPYKNIQDLADTCEVSRSVARDALGKLRSYFKNS